MNWDAIGAIGEIVGALAVVLSLIYLATQIRVSNKVAQRDSRMNLLELANGFWSGTADSPSLAKVRVKLRQSTDLSPEENEIARDWAQHVFFLISAIIIAAESNTISRATNKVYLDGIERLLKEYPGLLPIVRSLPEKSGIREGFSSGWDEFLGILNKT